MTQTGGHDVTAHLQDKLEHFVAEYRITSAEFRILCGMIEGLSASDIARREAVTYETVRSQLKSIFSKTHTHRQAELIALVLRHVTNPGTG